VVEGVVGVPAEGFSQQERDAVYRAIHERRDVRRGFLPAPMPDDLLERILCAAHHAPSVGFMQPWRFIVIRDQATRVGVHDLFVEANREAAEAYTGPQRERYADLKLEGILKAPQNLCVVFDPGVERGHGLGRQTMPETALYSVICAIQNLWLAARAEGIGVGWVSILDPDRLRDLLTIPRHVLPVAYLCLGFVENFATEPDLERRGWQGRAPVRDVLALDRYDRKWTPGETTA
jgi:5,6-dimethylbenzimidazole synthase